jgi:hypothetical protein
MPTQDANALVDRCLARMIDLGGGGFSVHRPGDALDGPATLTIRTPSDDLDFPLSADEADAIWSYFRRACGFGLAAPVATERGSCELPCSFEGAARSVPLVATFEPSRYLYTATTVRL